MAFFLGDKVKTFNLTRERIARIWVNQLPEPVQSSKVYVNARPASGPWGNEHILHRSIAVELFIPVGGRFLYGLLGCEFEPNEVSAPLIATPVFQREKHTVGLDSLADRLDCVEPWLDTEYHDSILGGAKKAAEKFRPFRRNLVFRSGRQGRLGSSSALYRRLAHLCVCLLGVPEDDLVCSIEEMLSVRSGLMA